MLRAILAEYRRAFAGLPAMAWWLSGVLLVHRSGTMVLPFLTLYLTRELCFSMEVSGLLLGAYGVGSAGGSLLGGRLSDRFGPRPVMLGSLALSAICFWILGQLHTQASLAIGLVLLGVVAEAFRPANGCAIAELCPPETHGRAFALQRLALNAGMTIGPLAGGFLAVISYELLFVVNGVGCVAALLFLTLFVRRWEPDDLPQPSASQSSSSSPEERPRVGSHSPWGDGLFMLVMAGVFLSVFPFLQVMMTAPVYYKDFYALEEPQLGVLFGVNTLIIVATEMVLIHRVSVYQKLNVVAVGCLFFAVGTAMIPLATGFGYAVITVGIWTVGEMLISPLAMAWVVERAPQGSTGRYLGVFSTGFSIGLVVTPFAGLYLYENVHPDAVWYTCAAICVAIIPIFAWAARRR